MRTAPPAARSLKRPNAKINSLGRFLAFVLAAVLGAAPAGASTERRSPMVRRLPDGGIGLRLTDVPVAEQNDPRARVYIVDQLAPGTVMHRGLEVSNTTTSTKHVVLYAAAATLAHGLFLGAAGHTRNDLSTWTSVRPNEVDVQAGQRVQATVTVAVPRNAAPGEQYAVVWAQVRSGPTVGAGVTEVSRVGMRLYIWAGAGGPPAADFEIASLTAKRSPEGRPWVSASIRNTGGRALDISGSLRLDEGPGRLRAGPFPADLGVTLGVGDAEPVLIELGDNLPAGPWRARIVLRSGLVQRAAEARLTFPRSGSAPPVAITDERGRSRNREVVAILALIALIAVAGALLRSRRPARS